MINNSRDMKTFEISSHKAKKQQQQKYFRALPVV